MSQQQLANKLRMDRRQISHYVTGDKTMSLTTAKTIASTLDCYIDDLYEWIEVKKSGVGFNE